MGLWWEGRRRRIGGGRVVGSVVEIEGECFAPWDQKRARAVAAAVEEAYRLVVLADWIVRSCSGAEVGR